MECPATDGAGKKRPAARTGRTPRKTKRGLAIHCRDDRENQRPALTRVVRRVCERVWRTFSALGGGAKKSSRAARRTRRAHCPDDARGDGDRAALSAVECRSSDCGNFVSRFRKALGKPLSRDRFRHGL